MTKNIWEEFFSEIYELRLRGGFQFSNTLKMYRVDYASQITKTN